MWLWKRKLTSSIPPHPNEWAMKLPAVNICIPHIPRENSLGIEILTVRSSLIAKNCT